MKKLMVSVLTLTMVLTSSIGVFAADTDDTEVVYNMDAKTYETRRMAQIDDAEANGEITSEQADLLRAHVLEVVADESFGNGPTNGDKGEGNAECVFGDDLNLGIFRSESAGMRTGFGNGVGLKLADGSGLGNGNQEAGNQNVEGKGNATGLGSGQGNRGANRGTGIGNGYDGECILD